MAHLFSRPSYSSTHFSQASLTQLRPDATECSEDTTELPPASLRSASGARRPSLLRDERGLSTVEYVVLLALIVVGCVSMWKTFSGTMLSHLTNANSQVTNLQPTGSEDGSTGSGTPPSSDSDPSASTGSPSSSGSGDLLQQAATAAQQAAQDAGL